MIIKKHLGMGRCTGCAFAAIAGDTPFCNIGDKQCVRGYFDNRSPDYALETEACDIAQSVIELGVE